MFSKLKREIKAFLSASAKKTETKEKTDSAVSLATFAGFLIAFVPALFVWAKTDIWIGSGTFILLFGVFVLHGLVRIEAAPPHKAVVTVFGKRQWVKVEDENNENRYILITVTKDEGWRFFPFHPFCIGFIEVPVERIPFGVEIPSALTPDRANSKAKISMTIRPDAEHLIEYQNSGTGEGVKTQLAGKIKDRFREFAIGLEEGPRTWKELQQSKFEATVALLKTVTGCGAAIPKNAQQVPTFIWMRYLLEPRPKVILENEERWAKDDWKEVKIVFNAMNDDEREKLEVAIREKREQIQKLRVGEGKIQIQNLGIILERLNVEDIDLIGEAAKVADAQAKENEERQAEELELDHVGTQIKKFMDPPYNYTNEQARAIVQTERGKVTRTMIDLNVPPGSGAPTVVPIVLPMKEGR